MDYFYIIIGIILIPLVAQIYVTSTYKKFSNINAKNSLNGFEVARKILDKNGLQDIHIVQTNGVLSDHYDSARKVIRLSNEVFNGTSISSGSVAAHEVGHALQDKNNYMFLKIRNLIFPIVSFASRFAYIIIFIGFILELADLINLGIAFASFGIIFQLVTLPVEFNASLRAKNELKKHSIYSQNELNGTEAVLKAAALTYVAGLLASVLQLLRLIMLTGNRRN